MQWFFIALGAPILWALVNVSDKYLVSHYTESTENSGALVLFSSLTGIIAALGIGIFGVPIFSVATLDILLLMIAGVLSICWIILYLKALEHEDVSSVVPWFLTVPVFGYAIGYIALGETLSMLQILGSAVVLIGAMFLSFDTKTKRLQMRGARYMLPASLIIAATGILFKFVAVEGDFWVSSFWEYIGLGLTGILLYVFAREYRKSFLSMLRAGGKKIFSLNFSSEIINIVGNLLSNYALLLAPVALVYLVGNFQPAIVLIFALIGSRFFPNVVKEDLSWSVLAPKIAGIAIMILGSIPLF